ncbi:MAG: ATP-grasp domain-containing protein [Nitrospinae bacterium]|nr:ATP-grasp domain-containing protein [Nitrospinota bacterium]
MNLELEIHRAKIEGRLHIGDQCYPLDEFSGIFLRTIAESSLPELQELPAHHPTHRSCTELHALLYAWCEGASGVVMNRTSAGGSNSSKPYQALTIRKNGFLTPPTLITNNPNEVHKFMSLHKNIIYKSTSGVRSIVSMLTEKDLKRLESIRWCPTQFQAYVEGTDIRVHTVGSEIFATEIKTNGVDYRYAGCNENGWTKLQATNIPDDVADQCLHLADELGLTLAGIDLRRTTDGRFYCFEVNPCPGFSYYESNTGQTISMAIARQLSGMK